MIIFYFDYVFNFNIDFYLVITRNTFGVEVVLKWIGMPWSIFIFLG